MLPHLMTRFVVAVFLLTYLGMALGRCPGLRIDRTGIALLAVVALLAVGALDGQTAVAALDMPTLVILFALMIISGQLSAAGFYGFCASRVASATGSPTRLLALTIVAAGLLSAMLANDIVVFAMTPLLCQGVRARGLDARPFLAGLAGASNAGSAATLLGNPQNILIGEVGRLDFGRFLTVCAPPALLALLLTYLCVRWVWRRELAAAPRPVALAEPALDRWHTMKAALSAILLLALYATPLPRPVAALLAAAPLLVSRKLATRQVLGTVDWNLILLFASLFVINAGLNATGLPGQALAWVEGHGLLPDRLAVLAPVAMVASNSIGNVPAVVMLLSLWPAPSTGVFYGLALLTTLAGNLLLVGSIANLIVAERAAREGVRFGFLDHLRAGLPLGVLSIGTAVLWLGGGGWLPWA